MLEIIIQDLSLFYHLTCSYAQAMWEMELEGFGTMTTVKTSSFN